MKKIIEQRNDGMTLSVVPIEEISEDDLTRLIEAAVPERQDIDYKLEAYGNSDSARREFLADISSFASLWSWWS